MVLQDNYSGNRRPSSDADPLLGGDVAELFEGVSFQVSACKITAVLRIFLVQINSYFIIAGIHEVFVCSAYFLRVIAVDSS